MTVAADRGPQRVRAAAVGLDFFAVFREQPAWGRTFDHTDTFGIRHVVVGHEIGRHLIGTQPAAPPTVRLDGLTFVVIGVMPQRFAFPADTQVGLPYGAGTEVRQGRGNSSVIARLAPGVSIAEARHRVGSTALERYSPLPGSEAVRSLRDDISRGTLPLLRLLMLLSMLLLVVTWVNVWGLGVVASSTHRHQTAIRMAVGATRWRLVHDIARRAAVVTACATVVGMVVAVLLSRAFAAAAASVAPHLDLDTIDWRLAAGTLGAALLTTVGLAAGEAVTAVRLDVRSSMLMSAVRSKGASRSRQFVIAGQISLAFILLSIAMAATEAVTRASRADSGFGRSAAVSIELAVPHARFTGSTEIRDLASRVRSRLTDRLAGASVGLADTTVGSHGFPVAPMALPGADRGTRRSLDNGAIPVAVSAGYFEAAGIALLAGRYFDSTDETATTPAVVISHAAVRQLGLSPTEAIGREVVHYFNDVRSTIVGVVGGVRLLGPNNEPPPVVYRPLGHMPRVYTLTVVVSGPGVTVPAVAEALHQFDPDVSVGSGGVLGEVMWPFLESPRLVQRIASTIALIAVLLAAVAVYGLLALDVASKQTDIAIRLALGEHVRTVRFRYLRSATAIAAAGIAFGLLLQTLAWSVAGSISPEIPRPSVLSLTAAAGAMLTAALWAASRPASAATAVDPASLLRGH